MAVIRPVPLQIYQQSAWWCWAACLEIINRMQPEKFGSTIRTQSEWVEAVQSAPAASVLLNSGGGINVHYLPAIISSLGMHGHSWAGPTALQPGTSPGGSSPSPRIVDASRIKQLLHSVYLLAGRPVPGGSHFVVIYGVDMSHFYYFDPQPGQGLRTIPHGQVMAAPLVIAWKP